jgi:hypothetical protein
MNIIRQIERRFGRLLGRNVPLADDRDRDLPADTVRVCQFGHAVFEGNNLCTYGHGPA